MCIVRAGLLDAGQCLVHDNEQCHSLSCCAVIIIAQAAHHVVTLTSKDIVHQYKLQLKTLALHLSRTLACFGYAAQPLSALEALVAIRRQVAEILGGGLVQHRVAKQHKRPSLDLLRLGGTPGVNLAVVVQCHNLGRLSPAPFGEQKCLLRLLSNAAFSRSLLTCQSMPCTASGLRSQAFLAQPVKQCPCQTRTKQLKLRKSSQTKQSRVLVAAQTSSRVHEDAFEDTAFLASVLGDTADRSPTKLSVSTRSYS